MNTAVIVGAGPAGLYTAIKLKEQGFDPIVLEEHEKIGLPEHCSGLISKKGVDDLKLNLGSSIQNEIKGVRIFSPNGTMIEIKRNNTVAYVVDRKVFDQELLNKAREKNVHVATNTKLIDVRNNTVFVQVNGRGELRKAEFVVGADGVNSTARHLIGISPKKESFVHTVQSMCSGTFSKEFVEIHLGDFAKGFFGWVIPISTDQAKIGLGNILGENTKENFENFIKTKMPSVQARRVESSLIPYGEPLQGIQKGNIALVGDAAFHTKATTGGGIIFGMKAAEILAESIANTYKNKKPLSEYEKKLEPLKKELRMHWKIRSYANSLDNKEIDSLFMKLKSKGIEEFLSKEGDMDTPSSFIGKMAKSPKYWFMAKTLLGIARS